MAVLRDVDIQEYIKQNMLVIDSVANHVQSSSYDMRVGTIFRDGQIINTKHARANEQVIVKPGEVVTMLTLECLSLPANIAATAYAINSQSLDGFLVLNPGHVDPGYIGSLSIKAVNLRKKDLCLSIGEPIFTVVFQKLENDVKKPYTSTKNRTDRELEINKKEVENSMKSIADLMSFTPEDIDKRILKHWSNKLYNSLAIAAALFSIISAVFTGLQLYQKPDVSKNSTSSTAPIINITNTTPAPSSSSGNLNQQKESSVKNASNIEKLQHAK